jgi:hypothetical protein
MRTRESLSIQCTAASLILVGVATSSDPAFAYRPFDGTDAAVAAPRIAARGHSVTGTKVEGYLDGKLYLQHTLAEPVSGRIGLWSKADSHVCFSDYTVSASN